VKRSGYVDTSDPPWLANGRGDRAANGQLESGEPPDHDPDTDHTHWSAAYNRTRPWQGTSCDGHGDFACEADVPAPSS
jgi:hypothetical protein